MRFRFTSLLLVAALLLTLPAAAQPTTGSLTGSVSDADGGALPGVTITLTSPQLIGGPKVAVSDQNGRFRFDLLPPGQYSLLASLEGFDAVEASQRVPLGGEAQVRLQLGLAAFEGDTVQVVAETPLLDQTDAGTGETFTQDYLQNAAVGIGGRDYLTVIGDAAGSVGTGNVRVFGSVGSDNVYLIDGLNTTDPLTATFGTNFNFDAIQEVTIQTGGFEAEYGQALGGIVNLVTKSGGNELSGSLDARYRDSGFTQDGEFFDADANDSEFRQLSATLGGPIQRDRAWFFLSGEKIDTEVTPEGAPSTFAFDGLNYIAKGTVQVTEGNRLVVKVSGDPTDIDNADADPFISSEANSFQEQGGEIYQAEWDSVLSDSVLLVAQAGITRQELNSYPVSGDLDRPGFTNVDTGITFGNATNAQFSERDRDEARADVTYFLDGLGGSHELKAGLGWQNLASHANNFTTGGFNVTYFEPLVDQNGDGLDAFILFRDFPLATAREFVDAEGDVISAFVQDTWRVGDRLTVNPGLRYDEASFDNEVGQTVAEFDKLQPRLGLTYDLTGDGRTLARAYWGRFMHPASANLADTISGRVSGFERFVSLDYWCGLGVSCDAGELAAIFGDPIAFNGDQFFPFDAITSPFESTKTLGIGELDAQYADQWSLGLERQIGRSSSVTLEYVDKRTEDLFEDVCNNGLWAFDAIPGTDDESFYTDPDGCTGFVLGNVAGLYRDYEALILKGETRLANRLSLLASWTYAESTGNSESAANQSYASAGYDSFPRDFHNVEGRLSDDRRHRVKISGYGSLPWDVTVGFNAFWISGQALDVFADCGNILAASPADFAELGIDPGVAAFCGNEVDGDLFLEPRGARRGDSRYQLDLQLSKGLDFGRVRMEAVGAVLNVLDDEDTTVYQEEAFTAVPWGTALDHLDPRRYEVGLRLEF
ncbi:MAG TPA: TonB-dependent receptor [Thermoanaerobaculia bacterium]|nr:TonB-dependent receptor [Thermoanaerobaculia bacterium]